ncbi:response regulator transcription factor [Chitinophaga caseinilytica]|uniref:Response regulator transcription factor n=1 Tax=Chitinophaga caseinilytica TaxID=2267521 RepID=A0ABZ2Z4C1_9BACT
MQIKLFIVDDHYMVIEGIRSLLQQEPSIAWLGHATNAASCISFLQHQQPDVILMDINLPDMSGIELCRRVHGMYPGCGILGLSTFNQHSVIRDMIDNGASGYLLKNAGKQELMTAILLAAKGKTYMSIEASASLKDSEHQIPILTRREKEILKLIAAGLTNAAIAEKLFISMPTVNTHRRSLLEKFDAKNTAILIGKAAKMGLIHVE